MRRQLCESCQQQPATLAVAFDGDGRTYVEPFAVCNSCAPQPRVTSISQSLRLVQA